MFLMTRARSFVIFKNPTPGRPGLRVDLTKIWRQNGDQRLTSPRRCCRFRPIGAQGQDLTMAPPPGLERENEKVPKTGVLWAAPI